MSDFWSAEAASPLTEEDFYRTFAALRDAPPHPCSRGEHIVNPKALYRPGWYVCGSCMAPVHVPVPLSEL